MRQSWEAERNLAMLIDGDNAQHSLVKQMFEESSRYGEVTIRRAYGDWTQPNLSNWRPVMLAHAIQPIQQWRYTVGKNATDSALIIDAMDILYSGTVQGFCIISSDSDYTRLCTRIRESGLFVMGIGKQQTPEAFINACNVFVYVENLIQPDEGKDVEEVKTPAILVTAAPIKTSNGIKNTDNAQILTAAETPEVIKPPSVTKQPTTSKANPTVNPPTTLKLSAKEKELLSLPIKPLPTVELTGKPVASQQGLLNLLRRAFDISEQDDDGWVHLGALGNALRRIEPSFDSRTYGFATLSLLIKSIPKQIAIKGDKKTGSSTIYARMEK
jgi:uncharacterized LabA/DUF88 family protein